jgi:hypothetical protein
MESTMPRAGYPSDKQDQYMVRFPDDMRDRLKKAAKDNTRSLNSEIIARLERSFAMDAANEEIYRRLSGGEQPEKAPPPDSEDDYGAEIPYSTDPVIGALEAEYHQELDQVTRRMAQKLANLREAGLGIPAPTPKKGRD